MKNPKITLLTILVIILAIMNVVVISIMWMHRPGGDFKHQLPFVILENGLDMTLSQKKAYKELRMAHRKMMENTREKASEVRNKLHQFERAQDDSTMEALTDSIGRLQAFMELNTYRHFVKVRSLCTPEQKKKFDMIIVDVLRKFAGPPPPLKQREEREHPHHDE